MFILTLTTDLILLLRGQESNFDEDRELRGRILFPVDREIKIRTI